MAPTSSTPHLGPVRPYRMSRGRRVGNVIMRGLIRLRAVPGSYLLTTTGRTSGLPRTTPVTVVELDGRRWLVAPYGAVAWVLNARAAGRVSLSRGRDDVGYRIREVEPAEAGPVLKAYIGIARPTRPYFRAGVGDPVDDFVAEAGLHPVFELVREG